MHDRLPVDHRAAQCGEFGHLGSRTFSHGPRDIRDSVAKAELPTSSCRNGAGPASNYPAFLAFGPYSINVGDRLVSKPVVLAFTRREYNND
jgi:hypothetical protein